MAFESFGCRPFLNAELRRLEARGKELVEKTETLLTSLQLDGKVILQKGAVAPTILEHAPGRNGLIVLGHRGLNALDRFVLGSVSAKVAQHATCSVLVVKEPPKPVRRVLLARDGSKPADRALQFLLKSMQTLYGKPGGPVEVVVMTVLPPVNNYPEARQTALALIHPYTVFPRKRVGEAGPPQRLLRPGRAITPGGSDPSKALLPYPLYSSLIWLFRLLCG